MCTVLCHGICVSYLVYSECNCGGLPPSMMSQLSAAIQYVFPHILVPIFSNWHVYIHNVQFCIKQFQRLVHHFLYTFCY